MNSLHPLLARRWLALAFLGALTTLACAADSGDTSTLEPASTPPPEGRLVEEGDVVKTEGTRLYVLSATRGLMVVELAVPAPRGWWRRRRWRGGLSSFT